MAFVAMLPMQLQMLAVLMNVPGNNQDGRHSVRKIRVQKGEEEHNHTQHNTTQHTQHNTHTHTPNPLQAYPFHLLQCH